MLRKFLRCSLYLALAAGCALPAAAQQRTSDPLTRFLDGIFKPQQGQGAQPQAAQPSQPAQPSLASQAQQPSQAAPAPTAQSQAKAPPAKPQPKAAASKKTSAKPQVAQPKTRPQPEPPQPVAMPEPAPKPVPAEPPVKQAAPERAPEPPVQAAEKPEAAPKPAPVKVAEPPKPARSTPAQTAAPAPTSVAAAGTPATPVSPPNPTSPAAALAQVNAYFNNMERMSAYFVQRNPNGQQVNGTLTVQRPGQLHFAYAPPSTLEIVSDGRNVAIRDKKLGTNDVYPVSQTPLKFLLQDKVDIARDTKLRDVQIARDGIVTVVFEDSATLGGTSKITLRFDSRANALRQWTIVDAQGYETSVTLSGLNVVQRKNASAD